MNVLANYASDSDSEGESRNTPTKNGQPIAQQQQQSKENVIIEDDFVSNALKDLQSFAASVGETTGNDSLRPGEQIGESEDLEELGLLSFLKEIDSIPCPLEEQDQEQILPPPPPSPPISSADMPPPPPPLLQDPMTLLSNSISDVNELTLKEIQMVYSRLYHLSLLPTPIDQKDLERRLLEFATRIVDYEKGGLYESYFLGQGRADFIESHKGVIGEAVSLELPSFGGIVGSMIKHMYELEQIVAPLGWAAVWDAEDEAYGFQHLRTGTYSPVFPSQELIHYLDPPTSRPPSSSMSPRNNRSYFTTRTAVTGGNSPSTTMKLSDNSSQVNTSPQTNIPKPQSEKTKKRKTDAIMADSVKEDITFMDPHIHPSRRAALTAKSGAGSLSSTAGLSSKPMPKKLASLLQKWSEKDLEESDEDDINNYQERQENNKLDSDVTSMTGSNAQSLGGDWRDRRSR
ncbi:hypothetical protein BGZ46_008514 [Entomortierella lignicola]|nr:hypothetical protein BGZ46_008514 [Entomortierella lignicola]